MRFSIFTRELPRMGNDAGKGRYRRNGNKIREKRITLSSSAVVFWIPILFKTST
jgi:hypothetical protein